MTVTVTGLDSNASLPLPYRKFDSPKTYFHGMAMALPLVLAWVTWFPINPVVSSLAISHK